MGQVWKGKATMAESTQLRAVTKHDAAMSSGERPRMIAAPETFRAARGDFDAEYAEEDWLEPEAEIARFLGDFSARAGWNAVD